MFLSIIKINYVYEHYVYVYVFTLNYLFMMQIIKNLKNKKNHLHF